MPSRDVTLMTEVALGDREAQRVVVRRLLRRIERRCRVLLRSRHDADDATQLSILEILRSAKSYRGESSLERWCDRIATRTALRAAASERRAQRMPLYEECYATQAPGEGELLARQFLAAVSERQRAVLILRHKLEYSVEEIAEICGISANSVKDRLVRARASLRRLLQPDHVSEP